MAGSSSRVLIADAEAVVRRQLFSALLDSNIFSDCVSTTAEALEKLESDDYGVVVLDVSLPTEIDPVLQRISKLPPLTRPVVLVLAASPESAHTLDVEIVQIVLRRPVDLPQLVHVITSCLRSAVRGPKLVGAPLSASDQPTS